MFNVDWKKGEAAAARFTFFHLIIRNFICLRQKLWVWKKVQGETGTVAVKLILEPGFDWRTLTTGPGRNHIYSWFLWCVIRFHKFLLFRLRLQTFEGTKGFDISWHFEFEAQSVSIGSQVFSFFSCLKSTLRPLPGRIQILMRGKFSANDEMFSRNFLGRPP